jgi:hypothetical protein
LVAGFWAGQNLADLAGDVAFEAADALFLRQAFDGSALQIGTTVSVVPHSGDDLMERARLACWSPPVWPVDLGDLDLFAGQVASQDRSVGTGAFQPMACKQPNERVRSSK